MEGKGMIEIRNNQVHLKSSKLEANGDIIFILKYSKVFSFGFRKLWGNVLKENLEDVLDNKFRIIYGLKSVVLYIENNRKENMLSSKSGLTRLIKEALIKTRLKISLTNRESQNHLQKRNQIKKNTKLINRYMDKRLIDSPSVTASNVVTDELLVPLVGDTWQSYAIVTLSEIKTFLETHAGFKLSLNWINFINKYKIKNALKVNSLSPFWATKYGKRLNNNDYLDLKLIEKRELENLHNKQVRQEKRAIKLKNVINLSKRIFIVLLAISVIFSVTIIVINSSRYTRFEITDANYESFVRINPIADVSEYYLLGSQTPDKYVYEISPEYTYLTEFEFEIDFLVTYLLDGKSNETMLVDNRFETEEPIGDFILIIPIDFNEEIRILKSDLDELDIIDSSKRYFEPELTPSGYVYQQTLINLDNYRKYLRIGIEDPVDHTRNSLYDYTSYEITLDYLLDENLYQDIEIVVEYTFSYGQIYTSSPNHYVEFNPDDLVKRDEFGDYPNYFAEVSEINGLVIAKEYINE